MRDQQFLRIEEQLRATHTNLPFICSREGPLVSALLSKRKRIAIALHLQVYSSMQGRATIPKSSCRGGTSLTQYFYGPLWPQLQRAENKGIKLQATKQMQPLLSRIWQEEGPQWLWLLTTVLGPWQDKSLLGQLLHFCSTALGIIQDCMGESSWPEHTDIESRVMTQSFLYETEGWWHLKC